MSTATTTTTPAEREPLVGVRVPLDQIRPSKTNPRKNFDKAQLQDLAQSIREKGVLQPVLLRSVGKPVAPAYELVVGERRFLAAKDAGLLEIPAMIRDLSDIDVIEIQVIENLQRADLHPLEEAEGYRQLMAKNYDVAKIASRTGRSVAYVYDRVKLLNLTKAAQKAFVGGEFTTGHAVILARLKPADQARALEEDGALFTDEHLLWSPDEEDALPGDDDPRKARSVRELQGWVDTHVKLEAHEADPMLFPTLAATAQAAVEEHQTVVRITHDQITPPEAKDGPRVILGRSWARADGKHGSKTCDRSVIGNIVIGAGRGEVLRVCVAKKTCTVHWGDLIKAAKKREKEVTKSGATGEDREALRLKKAKLEEARREAREKEWENATPAILEAAAAAVEKGGTGAGGAVGKYVLQAFQNEVLYNRPPSDKKILPAGKTAEDLIRHLAFRSLAMDIEQSMDRDEPLIKDLKALGVDAVKIVESVTPRCRECGCTEAKACDVGGRGCSWTEVPDKKTRLGLCSACASKKPAAKKAKG